MVQISSLYDAVARDGANADDAFFKLGLAKAERRKRLGETTREGVFLGPELKDLRPDGFRGIFDGVGAPLAATVVVTNNDVARMGLDRYRQIYDASPDTFFIGWDWDNHHWLPMSTFLAAHCDLYVPVHPDNRALLAQCNAAITEPINTGVVQWVAAFIETRYPYLPSVSRSREPLGKHTMYEKFTRRNRTVVSLGQHFPSINFNTDGWHKREPRDRWKEWAAHKCHWIVPVLTDLPTRMFDALITGGIPIVPEFLRFAADWSAFAQDDIMYYTEEDIVAPKPIVERACASFDKWGSEGVRRRHAAALSHHHADSRLALILKRAAKLYE